VREAVGELDEACYSPAFCPLPGGLCRWAVLALPLAFLLAAEKGAAFVSNASKNLLPAYGLGLSR
jgi:hypothetical protein